MFEGSKGKAAIAVEKVATLAKLLEIMLGRWKARNLASRTGRDRAVFRTATIQCNSSDM